MFGAESACASESVYYTYEHSINNNKNEIQNEVAWCLNFKMVSVWVCCDKKILRTFAAEVFLPVEEKVGDNYDTSVCGVAAMLLVRYSSTNHICCELNSLGKRSLITTQILTWIII